MTGDYQYFLQIERLAGFQYLDVDQAQYTNSQAGLYCLVLTGLVAIIRRVLALLTYLYVGWTHICKKQLP